MVNGGVVALPSARNRTTLPKKERVLTGRSNIQKFKDDFPGAGSSGEARRFNSDVMSERERKANLERAARRKEAKDQAVGALDRQTQSGIDPVKNRGFTLPSERDRVETPSDCLSSSRREQRLKDRVFNTGRRSESNEEFDSKKKAKQWLAKQKEKAANQPEESAEKRLLKNNRQSSHDATHVLSDDLKHLIDIDGDGHVDSEEYAMMKELEKIQGVDVDGDGDVDEHETRVAREMAGRRMMARRFVDRNDHMYRFDPKYMHLDRDGIIEDIAKNRHFARRMNELKVKERFHRLSGSDQVFNCVNQPLSGRPETGRNTNVSCLNMSDISYRVDKTRAKVLGESSSVSSNMWKSGSIGGRSREDLLFSSRAHRETAHNIHRGDIKGYGSFTGYLDCAIRNKHTMH